MNVIGPYQVLARPLALKPKDRIPPALGPTVRVDAVQASPATDEAGLPSIINGEALRPGRQAGFKQRGINSSGMWTGTWSKDLRLEFELPEAVPLSAIEVWNFNEEWSTSNGVQRIDVAVSGNGTNWRTVAQGVEVAEAPGTDDYDDPTVLKLDGVSARKVRFEKIVPWSTSGKVGLSAVVFHEAATAKAGPLRPEDGSTRAGFTQAALEWTVGRGSAGHRVYFGEARDTLALLGTTEANQMALPGLKPNTTYFWRVDEVQPNGSVVAGRVAQFMTKGLVAWWKLGEANGSTTEDASGHHLVGRVEGQPHWTAGGPGNNEALEFDGTKTFINCGNSTKFDFPDGMTVSAWIKVRQFDKPWQAIVTKGDDTWQIERANEGGQVMFTVVGLKLSPRGGAGRARVESQRDVNDGQWHHVVGLYDGRQMALYLDGKLEASVGATGVPAQNDEPVMIGANSSWRGRLFNGWMNDVRLYDCALSAEEILSLYHGGGEEKRADK